MTTNPPTPPIDADSKTEQRDLDGFIDLAKIIAWIAVGVAALIFVVTFLESTNEMGEVVETHQQSYLSTLGTVGDFFGGILNPIFAFLGLLALLQTLRLNQKELAATCDEMRKAAAAQEQQVNTLNRQIEKDELYKIIHSKCLEIDGFLDCDFMPGDSFLASLGDHRSIKTYRELIYTPRSEIDQYDSIRNDISVSLKSHTDSLLMSLRDLRELLQRYRDIDNSNIILNHYRGRYSRLFYTIIIGKHFDINIPLNSHVFLALNNFYNTYGPKLEYEIELAKSVISRHPNEHKE